MEIKPTEREIKHFVDILTASVEYVVKKHIEIHEDEEVEIITKKHLCGSTILTNRDLDKMLLNRFGNDYEFMTRPEQRKMREAIFKRLRGGSNG